jgi:hypothetical protein
LALGAQDEVFTGGVATQQTVTTRHRVGAERRPVQRVAQYPRALAILSCLRSTVPMLHRETELPRQKHARERVSLRFGGTRSTRHGCSVDLFQEAIMSHWPEGTPRADAMRGTAEDEMGYMAGWTISGLATLGTILAVWIFAV